MFSRFIRGNNLLRVKIESSMITSLSAANKFEITCGVITEAILNRSFRNRSKRYSCSNKESTKIKTEHIC